MKVHEQYGDDRVDLGLVVSGEHRAVIVRNSPFDHYRDLPAYSRSAIDRFLKSPATFKYGEQDDTEAMMLGRAFHELVLLPDEFTENWCPEPDPKTVAPDAKNPRATKAYKSAVAGLQAAGKTVLTQAQGMLLFDGAAALNDHPIIAKALAKVEPFDRELTIVWAEELPDVGVVPCKMRLDLKGPRYVADLKFVADIDRFDVFYSGLYRQAGFYRRGFMRAFGSYPEEFFFFVADKGSPARRRVDRIATVDAELGEAQCLTALRDMALCEASDEWPAGPDRIKTQRLTRWQRRKIEQEMMR